MSKRSHYSPALTPAKFPIPLRIKFQHVTVSSEIPCNQSPNHLSHSYLIRHSQLSNLPLFQLLKLLPVSGPLHLLLPHQKFFLCISSHVTSSERTSLPTTQSKMAPFLSFSILLPALLFFLTHILWNDMIIYIPCYIVIYFLHENKLSMRVETVFTTC